MACLQIPQLTLGLSQLLPQHQHHLAPKIELETPFSQKKKLQGAPRFELGTYRSAVDCSTTELYTRNHGQGGRWAVYIPGRTPPPHNRAGDLAEE